MLLLVTACAGGTGKGATSLAAAAAAGGGTSGGNAAPGTTSPGTATGGTTATPGPTGTYSPLSSTCGAVPLLANGQSYSAGWAPYSCSSSPWNTRVSSNPTYASYSSAVIASEFVSGNTQPVREEEAGTFDYGHAIYYAASTDPLVTLRCTEYCDKTDNGGFPASVHVPAQARPALGEDGQMSVIQPDGSEIDMWAAQQPSGDWSSGSTLTALAMTNCGSFLSSSGFVATGPAATASGACLGAGLLRADELLAGTIDHALFLVLQCAVGWQYPAFPKAGTAQCTGGSGPALGARIWYDVPDATTNANSNLAPWEKAILNALHDYGAYFGDDIGGGYGVSGIGFLAESGEAAEVYGLPDPFAALASQGWHATNVSGSLTPRYIGADTWNPNGVNFAQHMHWLDPCSAHGTC